MSKIRVKLVKNTLISSRMSDDCKKVITEVKNKIALYSRDHDLDLNGKKIKDVAQILNDILKNSGLSRQPIDDICLIYKNGSEKSFNSDSTNSINAQDLETIIGLY